MNIAHIGDNMNLYVPTGFGPIIIRSGAGYVRFNLVSSCSQLLFAKQSQNAGPNDLCYVKNFYFIE